MWKMPLLSMNVPGSCSGLQTFPGSRKWGFPCSTAARAYLKLPAFPDQPEKAWSLFPVTNRKRGSIQPSSRFLSPPGDLQSLQDCFSPQSLSWPYKDLLPANISKRTEFYFACITCPTARKRDDCTPIELWEKLSINNPLYSMLDAKAFYGTPPTEEPLIPVTKKEHIR